MTDHKTVRVVIVFVGLIAFIGLAFIGLLAWDEKNVPDALIAVTTTALGALSSMLVSTRGGSVTENGGGVVTADVNITAPADSGQVSTVVLLLVAILAGVVLLLFGVGLDSN